jgi:enoyl-CoA hydratase/carnithine racemase
VAGGTRAFESRAQVDFVNRVVPVKHLAESVRALGDKMSGYFPFGMSLTRNSVYRALDMDFDAAVEEETAALLSYMGGSRNTGMSRAMNAIGGKRPRPE